MFARLLERIWPSSNSWDRDFVRGERGGGVWGIFKEGRGGGVAFLTVKKRGAGACFGRVGIRKIQIDFLFGRAGQGHCSELV